MSHLQSKKYNPIAFLLCKQNIAKRNFRLRAKLFEQNRHRKRKEEIHPGIKSTKACTYYRQNGYTRLMKTSWQQVSIFQLKLSWSES